MNYFNPSFERKVTLKRENCSLLTYVQLLQRTNLEPLLVNLGLRIHLCLDRQGCQRDGW